MITSDVTNEDQLRKESTGDVHDHALGLKSRAFGCTKPCLKYCRVLPIASLRAGNVVDRNQEVPRVGTSDEAPEDRIPIEVRYAHPIDGATARNQRRGTRVPDERVIRNRWFVVCHRLRARTGHEGPAPTRGTRKFNRSSSAGPSRSDWRFGSFHGPRRRKAVAVTDRAPADRGSKHLRSPVIRTVRSMFAINL